MTKADRIRALHAKGKSVREIAEAIHGHQKDAEARDRKMAYVRVVLRQRIDGGKSKHDVSWVLKRYKATSLSEAYRLEARERYAHPVRGANYRAYQREYQRQLRLERQAESG